MASLYITAAIDVDYFQKINIRHVRMRNSVVDLENIRSYIDLILLTKNKKNVNKMFELFLHRTNDWKLGIWT